MTLCQYLTGWVPQCGRVALDPDSEMQENQLGSLRNKHTGPNAPKQTWPCVKTGLLESSTNNPDFTARVERRCETENKICKDLSAFSFLSLGQYAVTVTGLLGISDV